MNGCTRVTLEQIKSVNTDDRSIPDHLVDIYDVRDWCKEEKSKLQVRITELIATPLNRKSMRWEEFVTEYHFKIEIIDRMLDFIFKGGTPYE